MTPLHELRYRRWWQATGWLLLAVVAVNALLPWPHVEEAPEHLDKYLHAGTFFALAVWLCGVYERRYWPAITVGLILFGAAIEFAQGRTGYRYPELADMGANLVGLFIGLAASTAGLAGWPRLVESWLPGADRA